MVPVPDDNVLVGYQTGDDAAVYRLGPDRALAATADFFTPIVDDPFDFGRIAAANALSDLYAMGASPLFALNLVGFPRKLLSEGILEEILRGGSLTARAAGLPILGGHSIDDPEPKYGLVAIGELHPDRMVTNAAARPGDLLVLTKPLGTGVVATAIKREEAAPRVVRSAVESMAALNEGAAKVMRDSGVAAATDVTGYGLLGHLRAMILASGASATVHAYRVPELDGVRALVRDGHVPGGTKRNLADLAPHLDFDPGVDDDTKLLLADAQTSGGILMSVPPTLLSVVLEGLGSSPPPGTLAAVVGEVRAGAPGRIRVSSEGP